MDNTETTTAGRLPATLEAKITAYEDTLLEQLRTACNRFGISGRTEAQIADDLSAQLRYTGEPIHLDRDGFKELTRQADFFRYMLRPLNGNNYMNNIPLTFVAETYANIERVSDIIGTIWQSAEPSKERQLISDLCEAFTASTPWAQAEILRRYTWIFPDNETRYLVARQRLTLFYLFSISFSGATAEELLQVEPIGLTLTEKEREAVVQEALRAAADYNNRVNARTSTANEKAEEIGVDIEIPEEISPKGEPTISGMADDSKPVEEAVYIDEDKKKQGNYFFWQSYTRLLSRPLPVSFISQEQQSTEPIRIRDLKRMPDLFKEQADKYGISETRIYQFLDALQIIAQEDGEKHFIRGYDYYFYDTTLPNIIRIGTGSDTKPNGRILAEFWVAGWILNNIRIYVDEEIIKGYFTDEKTNKKKAITEPREALIQILSVPIITTPKKPKDKNAYTAVFTLQIHCFVKDGRTRQYIMDGKLRRAIKLPRYDKVPKEEEDLARKLFNRKDTGIRFYKTLRYCRHKEEEELLAQVFDYQRKQSKTQSEEEYRRVEDSIKRHKWQDTQSLTRMFERAKQHGILDSYERRKGKVSVLTNKPTYIWEWKLHNEQKQQEQEADE